ncbi:MAG: hypothetical protein EU539_12935 [Promethearchaeota archaeon]|nr:MAG: hypothetical protein EU539_12935 [Candidatus Lokiarchaeota archaeon]
MAWGGFLNKNGSDYIRKLREVEKIITFLENFKERLSSIDRKCVIDTIKLIIKHFEKDYMNSRDEKEL